MEVLNDLLEYGNMKIVQNSEWFSFSLDSVLLASFARVNKKTKIIDFCTGNAPIPLFLHNKTAEKIIGVELQKDVFELAKKSIKINKLDNKIELINEDVNNLVNIYDSDTFDLITCNPPYFKCNEGSNYNKNEIKSIARHEITINLNEIMRVAKKILKNNGKIVIVHRTDRLIDIIDEMKKNNIEPKRIRLVYPYENKNSNIVLIEGSKNGNSGLIIEPSIIVHDEGGAYKENILKLFSGGSNEN